MPKLVKRLPGTAQQVRDYDIARRELARNAEKEKRKGIRHETEKYHRLNHQVAQTEKCISWWQQLGSDKRLIQEENRERRTERRERRADHKTKRLVQREENRERRSDGHSARLGVREERRDDHRERRSDRREQKSRKRSR